MRASPALRSRQGLDRGQNLRVVPTTKHHPALLLLPVVEFGLDPERLSNKVRDIVGLYVDPPIAATAGGVGGCAFR